MKKNKLKLGVVALLFLGLSNLQAQEAVPASGGEAGGSGGSVSYTVGQVVYTTKTGTNGNSVTPIFAHKTRNYLQEPLILLHFITPLMCSA